MGEMIQNIPKYSIIITAYNRREYLWSAFQSAVSQDYTGNYEIVVVSNFVDEKIYAESQKNPSFVLYIVNESELLGRKQVTGILAARGQWLCLLEDDDLFCRRKLSEIDGIVDTEKNVGIIKHPLKPIDSFGNEITYPDPDDLLYRLLNPIGISADLKRKEYSHYYKIPPVQSDYFNLYSSFSNNSSLMVKREMLLNYLEILKNIKLSAECYFLSLALLERKDLIIAKNVLGMYRIHSSNSSNMRTDPEAALNNLAKISSDFKLVSSLPLQKKYKNTLMTISSRLQILYLFRMHVNGQLPLKQIIKPGLLTTLLFALFGKPERRIFLLPFHSVRTIFRYFMTLQENSTYG